MARDRVDLLARHVSIYESKTRTDRPAAMHPRLFVALANLPHHEGHGFPWRTRHLRGDQGGSRKVAWRGRSGKPEKYIAEAMVYRGIAELGKDGVLSSILSDGCDSSDKPPTRAQ